MKVRIVLEDGSVLGEVEVRPGSLWRGLVTYTAEQWEREASIQQAEKLLPAVLALQNRDQSQKVVQTLDKVPCPC